MIETLHPVQRQLWRNICTAVNNQAEKDAAQNWASTEVCIEIKSVQNEKKWKKSNTIASEDKIAFKVDMTLKDMGKFLKTNSNLGYLGGKK